MSTIILYVVIMACGLFLARKGIIPERIKPKLGHCQTFALIFLLGVLGYKLGSDKRLLEEIHLIGFQAFSIAVMSVVFSILFVYLFYRKGER